MRARPGWRRGGADVDAVDACAVRVQRESWPDQRLPGGVRAGDDVAAYVVGVAGLQLRRVPRRGGDDSVTEPRREALELAEDRLRRIPAVAGRHVRIHPDRVE